MWLKVNNVNPDEHKIKEEMRRLQDYYCKLVAAKNKANELGQINLNQNAQSNQMVLISGSNQSNQFLVNTIKSNELHNKNKN